MYRVLMKLPYKKEIYLNLFARIKKVFFVLPIDWSWCPTPKSPTSMLSHHDQAFIIWNMEWGGVKYPSSILCKAIRLWDAWKFVTQVYVRIHIHTNVIYIYNYLSISLSLSHTHTHTRTHTHTHTHTHTTSDIWIAICLNNLLICSNESLVFSNDLLIRPNESLFVRTIDNLIHSIDFLIRSNEEIILF